MMGVAAGAAARATDPEPPWFDDPLVAAARAGRADRGGTPTPQRYRRQSIVIAAAALVLSLLGLAGAAAINGATTETTEQTGPVLVATQSLRASLAEADAAATAAYLTLPDEDPGQRRAYTDAVARATAQIEDIAASLGDDPEAHATLQEIAGLLVRYSGLIEAARASRLVLATGQDDPSSESPLDEAANALLVQAVELQDGELSQATERLSELTRARLDTQLSGERTVATVVVLLAGLVVAALLVAQVAMAQRSRRIVNPLLALATIAVLVAGVWFAGAFLAARSRFDDAVDRAFASILTTADVQTGGYAARAAETVALITGDAEAQARADEAIRLLEEDAGLFAALRNGDTARESALGAEAEQRWARYVETVGELRAASGQEAFDIAIGPLLSTFNGFNFAVEGVLADNREDFIAGLDSSGEALSGLPVIALLLPLVATGAIAAGFQRRINEYR